MSEDSIFIVNVQYIQVIAFQMRNSPENTLILFIFGVCKFKRGENIQK